MRVFACLCYITIVVVGIVCESFARDLSCWIPRNDNAEDAWVNICKRLSIGYALRYRPRRSVRNNSDAIKFERNCPGIPYTRIFPRTRVCIRRRINVNVICDKCLQKYVNHFTNEVSFNICSFTHIVCSLVIIFTFSRAPASLDKFSHPNYNSALLCLTVFHSS